MKKLITFLLIICFWFPLTGFSNITSGTVAYQSGQVKEVVSITISNADAQAINKTLDEFVDAVQSVMPLVKVDVQTALQNKVNTDPEINPLDFQNSITVDATLQQVENVAQVGLVITYNTRAHWQYFCNTEDITTTQQNSLFIKKYITTSPIRFAVFDDNNTPKTTVQFVYDKLTTRLENYLGDITGILSAEYSYTYALKANRIHSDADLVEHDASTGLTYYTWQCDFATEKQITFWQTRANVIAWYALAVAITGGFGLVLWLVSKKQKPQSQQPE